MSVWRLFQFLRCLFKVAFLGHWINWLCHKSVKVHQEFHKGIIFMRLEKPSVVAKKVWASINYVSLILLELVDIQLCENVRWRQVICKWNSGFLKENNAAFTVMSYSMQMKTWLSYLGYIYILCIFYIVLNKIINIIITHYYYYYYYYVYIYYHNYYH